MYPVERQRVEGRSATTARTNPSTTGARGAAAREWSENLLATTWGRPSVCSPRRSSTTATPRNDGRRIHRAGPRPRYCSDERDRSEDTSKAPGVIRTQRVLIGSQGLRSCDRLGSRDSLRSSLRCGACVVRVRRDASPFQSRPHRLAGRRRAGLKGATRWRTAAGVSTTGRRPRSAARFAHGSAVRVSEAAVPPRYPRVQRVGAFEVVPVSPAYLNATPRPPGGLRTIRIYGRGVTRPTESRAEPPHRSRNRCRMGPGAGQSPSLPAVSLRARSTVAASSVRRSETKPKRSSTSAMPSLTR